MNCLAVSGLITVASGNVAVNMEVSAGSGLFTIVSGVFTGSWPLVSLAWVWVKLCCSCIDESGLDTKYAVRAIAIIKILPMVNRGFTGSVLLYFAPHFRQPSALGVNDPQS